MCALPELLAKWYIKSIVPNQTVCASASGQANTEDVIFNKYCYCHGPEEGAMIACDSPNCKVQRFHMKCLKMNNAQCGKWYCPDCRKLPAFKINEKKRKPYKTQTHTIHLHNNFIYSITIIIIIVLILME